MASSAPLSEAKGDASRWRGQRCCLCETVTLATFSVAISHGGKLGMSQQRDEPPFFLNFLHLIGGVALGDLKPQDLNAE